MRNRPGHGQRLSYYDFGATTVYAARADQRLAWCAYIPESYEESGGAQYPLVVIVHGTERGMLAYRSAFTHFAEQEQVIVLCPLFPANLCFPGDLSTYKMLRAPGVDYDLALLSMIDEARAKWRIAGERVLMYGFSGGAHFTHRFLYLHPERLLAAAVAAPGVVTLLDDRYDFWVGVRDFGARFGREPDRERIRDVPVLLLVGEEDRETWEITIRPGDPWWMDGADLAGPDRVARIHALGESLTRAGVAVELAIAPGTAHDDRPLIPIAQRFFQEQLRRLRAGS